MELYTNEIRKSAAYGMTMCACVVLAVMLGLTLSQPYQRIALSVLLGLATIAGIFYLRWAIKEDNLKKLLGSTPFELPRRDRWKWQQLHHKKVGEVLQKRAQRLDEAFMRENDILKGVDLLTDDPYKELLSIQTEIRFSKKHFWDAANLFRSFRFSVAKSYKDHLPKS